MDSPKMIGEFQWKFKLQPVFLSNSTGSFVTSGRFSLFSGMGKFLGIIGEDPSVFTSNRLHVMIFWYFFFINVRCIPWIPLR
jgi:hypothetical protein